jgi:hypothetical protein
MPETAGSTAEQEKLEILGDTSISGDAKLANLWQK